MKNLYVGNLPHSTTEAELRNVFEPHGAVEKVTRLVASLPGENHLVVVKGANHFFSGHLDQLDAAITAWLEGRVSRPRH